MDDEESGIISAKPPRLQRRQLGQKVVVAIVVQHREAVAKGTSGDQAIDRGPRPTVFE